MNQDFLRFDDEDAHYRLIILHGWGADVDDLVPLGIELRKAVPKNLELIFLRAPHLHPDGIGRQWYGLFPADWSAVPSAINNLQNRIIALETNKISLNQTFVLGFSQGAAMALGSGCEMPLAGIISCSGYSHPDWQIPLSIPRILLIHGKYDEIVPSKASEMLFSNLNKSDDEVELFLFQGRHEIPQEAIEKIASNLSNWLE